MSAYYLASNGMAHPARSAHVPEPPGQDPDNLPEIPPPQQPEEDIDLPPREDPPPVREPDRPGQTH